MCGVSHWHYNPHSSTHKHVAQGLVKITSNPYIDLLKMDSPDKTFSEVKEHIKNFASHSQALLSILDGVAKAHPVIDGPCSILALGLNHRLTLSAIAVYQVFKALIKLELQRRENNEKVIALHVTMCDMMGVLTACVLCCPDSIPKRIERHS